MKKVILPILIILLGIIFYNPIDDNTDLVPPIKYYEVEIKGEVINPGVYKVRENTTVRMAVEKAGRTNKSVFVGDNEYIKKNTTINVATRVKSIDINRATKEELMMIPKIGEKKAIAIIKYRREHKFSSYVELKELLKINNNEILLEIMANTIIK